MRCFQPPQACVQVPTSPETMMLYWNTLCHLGLSFVTRSKIQTGWFIKNRCLFCSQVWNVHEQSTCLCPAAPHPGGTHKSMHLSKQDRELILQQSHSVIIGSLLYEEAPWSESSQKSDLLTRCTGTVGENMQTRACARTSYPSSQATGTDASRCSKWKLRDPQT